MKCILQKTIEHIDLESFVDYTEFGRPILDKSTADSLDMEVNDHVLSLEEWNKVKIREMGVLQEDCHDSPHWKHYGYLFFHDNKTYFVEIYWEMYNTSLETFVIIDPKKTPVLYTKALNVAATYDLYKFRTKEFLDYFNNEILN